MASDFQDKLDQALAAVEEQANPFGIGISDGLLTFLARSLSMNMDPKIVNIPDDTELAISPDNRIISMLRIRTSE